jgi:hypothetical protein
VTQNSTSLHGRERKHPVGVAGERRAELAVGDHVGNRGCHWPLLELRPEGEMIAELPYAEIQCALDDPPGLRNYVSVEHLEEFPDAAIDPRRGHGRALELAAGASSQGGAVARQAGDWALPHRRAGWALHPFGHWESPADDERGIAWVKAICADVKPWATGDVYLNFIGNEGEERVIAGFAPANHARPATVKAQYDPGNVFRA